MSITIKNLESALAGESQAHIKYRYFAKMARAEGFEEIAKHFEHTADQELLHAWGHLELLVGKPDTRKCLEMAIEGETYEFTTMYPDFAKTARAEGLNDIAKIFEFIATAERWHEDRYRKLASNLKEEKVFSKEGEVEWVCRNCGYTHKGKNAPAACPACAHPQAHFEVAARNW